MIKNNICLIESYIQESDAQDALEAFLKKINPEEFELLEFTIMPLNGKYAVRVLATPKQGELFD